MGIQSLIVALFGVFSVIAVAISVLASLSAARTAAELLALQERYRHSPASRIDSVEQRIEELSTAIGDVANRVKMQRVRTAANHVPDEKPSSKLDRLKQDPEKWRNEINKRIGTGWRPGQPLAPGDD